jgi:tetratricopeptide (TPR) repeat protein
MKSINRLFLILAIFWQSNFLWAAELSPEQFLDEFFAALQVQNGEKIGQLVLAHPKVAEQAQQLLTLAGEGTDEDAKQFRVLAEILAHSLQLMRLNRLLAEAETAYQSADYTLALEKLQAGLKKASEVDDQRYRSQFLSDLGVVHETLEHDQQALNYYQQALSIKRQLVDKQAESQILTHIASIYTKLKQYQTALSYYQQAIDIQRQLDDKNGLGNNLSNLGGIYAYLGQYQPALKHFLNALSIHRELAQPPAIAHDLSNLGIVYDQLGHYQKALDAYQQALTIQRELDNQPGIGNLLTNIGLVYNHLGQYTKALDYYQQALTLYRKIPYPLGEGTNLSNIGNVYQNIGQYQQALEAYQQALAIQRNIGNQRQVGDNLSNLGVVYQSLGQHQHALEYYQPALDIFREVGDKLGECAVLTNIGVVHDSLGDYQPALKYYQQALSINREIGYQLGEGTDLTKMGHVYHSLGQYQQALDYYQQALVIHKTLGNKAEEGTVLAHLGAVYDRLKLHQQALQAYQQALAIYHELGSADIWIAQRGLGSVEVQLNQFTAAIEHYQQALTQIETLRAGLTKKAYKLSFMQDKLDVYDELITLSQILHERHPDTDDYARQALETFERKQGRLFLEEMGQSGARRFAGLPASVIKEEQLLRQQQTKVQANLVQERNKPVKQQNLSVIETLIQRLDMINTSRQALHQQIQVQYPNYYALKYPQPVTVETLQNQVLQSKERMLIYSVMENRTVLWVIGPRQFSLFNLPVEEDTFGEEVAYLRMLILNQLPQFTEKSFELYQKLFPTAIHQLLAGADTLYIIPTGPLYGLPFETLVTEITTNTLKSEEGMQKFMTEISPNPSLPKRGMPRSDDTPHYLIQDYAIAYLSSASLLKILRDTATRRKEQPSQSLIAFANPNYPPCQSKDDNENPFLVTTRQRHSLDEELDGISTELNQLRTRAYLRTIGKTCFVPLPETAEEAKAIATLFGPSNHALYLGQQASRQTLLALNKQGRLDDYRYILFAAHGILPTEVKEIEQPALVLSNPLTEGYLTMADAFTLQLNADFINLSACNTGVGDRVKGEGIMGLTRAFMYAGTSAISVTLWSVESLSAKTLSIDLFKNLKAGKKVAETLRQTKLKMIERKTAPTYHHPFYWAPYVVYGN